MIERSDGQGVKHRKATGATSTPKLAPRPETAPEAKGPALSPDAQGVQGEASKAAAASLKQRTQTLATYGEGKGGTGAVAKTASGTTPSTPGDDGSTNPLDETGARPVVNVVSGIANGGDVLKDVGTYGTVVREVGSKAGLLGRIFEPVARLLDGAAGLASKVPGLMPVCSFLGKAAPMLGVLVAGLDVTRAVLEKDPVRQQRYQGQAAMSCVGAVAGVVAFAGITGATLFGLAVAPVAVPIAIGVGITAGLVSVIDEFAFGGKVASAIGGGMRAAASWVGGLFS